MRRTEVSYPKLMGRLTLVAATEGDAVVGSAIREALQCRAPGHNTVYVGYSEAGEIAITYKVLSGDGTGGALVRRAAQSPEGRE